MSDDHSDDNVRDSIVLVLSHFDDLFDTITKIALTGVISDDEDKRLADIADLLQDLHLSIGKRLVGEFQGVVRKVEVLGILNDETRNEFLQRLNLPGDKKKTIH